MNPLDMIIDKSSSQKIAYLEKVRIELARLGYSIIRTDWLRDLERRAA